MSTDSLQDPWAELRRLQERIARLETASPLENGSISRSGIRAVIPGGNDDGDGATKYGHAGGKIGFLLRDGGSWKTIPEWTSEKITQSHEYPTARIGDLEGRMTSTEAGVTYTANRTTDLEGRVGPLEGRMADAEGDIAGVPGQISASHAYPNARISDLEGRMGSAESNINAKASQSALNNLVTEVGQLKVTVAQIKDRYNDHIDAGHPGFPKVTA